MTPYQGRVPAVAYLRTDLYGAPHRLDEQLIGQLSLRLGYELCETIRADATKPARIVLLEDRIQLHKAEAVFIPTVEDLDGQLGRIVAQADVIERNGRTHARWSPYADLLDEKFVIRLAQLWAARRGDDRQNKSE